MTQFAIAKVYTQTSPGALRAVACDADGRPVRLFTERWGGAGDRARFGAISEARLRSFADALRGAFCELPSGEQVFLRLKSREDLTEGQAVRLRIESEARFEKLARGALTEAPLKTVSGLTAWCAAIGMSSAPDIVESADRVSAAFDEALSPSVTLPRGGKLHIERTRALTAFDIDTAGRKDKGSAGARALAINQDAIGEMARQIAVRGLGGAFVLDCVSPIHASAGDRLRAFGRSAVEAMALAPVRLLKPSDLGLLQAALPWRFTPVEDERTAHPAETELLDLMRHLQREAEAIPTKFFTLLLGGRVWRAYQERKSDADRDLQPQFSGRGSEQQGATDTSEVIGQ